MLYYLNVEAHLLQTDHQMKLVTSQREVFLLLKLDNYQRLDLRHITLHQGDYLLKLHFLQNFDFRLQECYLRCRMMHRQHNSANLL